MIRRTAVTALAGALMVVVLGAPAHADPIVPSQGGETQVCVRTDGGEGPREGYCVWVPVGR